MMKPNLKQKYAGFSAMEMMVVVAIIAIWR